MASDFNHEILWQMESSEMEYPQCNLASYIVQLHPILLVLSRTRLNSMMSFISQISLMEGMMTRPDRWLLLFHFFDPDLYKHDVIFNYAL